MVPRWIIALCIGLLLPSVMCRRAKVKRNARSYPEKGNWYQMSRQRSWGSGRSNGQDGLNSVVQMPGEYGNRISPTAGWQQDGRRNNEFDQGVTQDAIGQTTQSYGQGTQNDNGYGSQTEFVQEGITDGFGQGVDQAQEGQRPGENQTPDAYGSNGSENNGGGSERTNEPQVPGDYNGSRMRGSIGSEENSKLFVNAGYDQNGRPGFGQQDQRPAPGRYGQRKSSNDGVKGQYGGQRTGGPISGFDQERKEYGVGQNGDQDGNQNVGQGVTQSNQNGGVYRQEGYPATEDYERGDRNVGGRQNGNPNAVAQNPDNGNGVSGYGQAGNQGTAKYESANSQSFEGQTQATGPRFNGQNDGYGGAGHGGPSWSSNSWQTTLQNDENLGGGSVNPPNDNFIPSSRQPEQGIWDGDNTNGQENIGRLSSPNEPGSSWDAMNSQMYQSVDPQPKAGTSQAIGSWEPIIMQGRTSEFGNQFTGQGNPPYDSTAKQMAQSGGRGYNSFRNQKGSNYGSKDSQNGAHRPQRGGGGSNQFMPSNGAANSRGNQNNPQNRYNGIKTQQNGGEGERRVSGSQANQNNGNYIPNERQNSGRSTYSPQNGRGGAVRKGGSVPHSDSNYGPQERQNGNNERYGSQSGQTPSHNAESNGAGLPPGQFGQLPQNDKQGNGIGTQPGSFRPVSQNGGQGNGIGMPIGQYPKNGGQNNGIGMPPGQFGQYPQNGGQGNGMGISPGPFSQSPQGSGQRNEIGKQPRPFEQSPQNGGQENGIGTQPSPFGQAPQNGGGEGNGIRMPPSPFGPYPKNNGQGNGIGMLPSPFGQAPQNGDQANGIGMPPSPFGQYPMNDRHENGEGTQPNPSSQTPLNGQEVLPGAVGSSVPGQQDAGRNIYGNAGQTGYMSGRPGQVPINPNTGRPVQFSGGPGQTTGIPSYGRPGKAFGGPSPGRPGQLPGGPNSKGQGQGTGGLDYGRPEQSSGGPSSERPRQTTGTPSNGSPAQAPEGSSSDGLGQSNGTPAYGIPGQSTDDPSSGKPGQSPGGSGYDGQSPFDGSNGLRGQVPFDDRGNSGQTPVSNGDTYNIIPGSSARPQGNFKGGDEGDNSGDDPSQWRIEDSIPGTPGEDYPNLNSIPDTGFDCKQQPNPGYYGDVNAQCQVFHICQADGRSNSFLCPVGTIFNQQYFICDWWFNVNCAETPNYFNLNSNLYDYSENGNFKGDPFPSNGATQQAIGNGSPENYPPITGSGQNGGLGDTGYSGESGMPQTPSVPPSGSYPGATGPSGGDYMPSTGNAAQDGQNRGVGTQGGRNGNNGQGTDGYDQNQKRAQPNSWTGQSQRQPNQSSQKGRQFRPSNQGGSWNGEGNQINLNGGDVSGQGQNTQSPRGDSNQGWAPIDQSSTKSPGRPQDGGQYSTVVPQGGNAAQDDSWDNMNNNRRGGKGNGNWDNGDNSYQSSRWQSGGSAATSSAANSYFQQNHSWSLNAPDQQRFSWFK